MRSIRIIYPVDKHYIIIIYNFIRYPKDSISARSVKVQNTLLKITIIIKLINNCSIIKGFTHSKWNTYRLNIISKIIRQLVLYILRIKMCLICYYNAIVYVYSIVGIWYIYHMTVIMIILIEIKLDNVFNLLFSIL